MSKERHTPEQIISKLREAEILLSQGQSVPVACKRIEVSEQTYYRWRKDYGGLRTDQAKRFKELERENGRLKKLVADQALDNAILKFHQDFGEQTMSDEQQDIEEIRNAVVFIYWIVSFWSGIGIVLMLWVLTR